MEDGLGGYMVEIKPSESCDEGEWKCVVTSNDDIVGISTCMVYMDGKEIYLYTYDLILFYSQSLF